MELLIRTLVYLLKHTVALTYFFFLCACASQVTTISSEDKVDLNEGAGFLLIAVDTNLPLNKILISGKKTIELTSRDLQRGSNYILTPIPAGKYKINRVELNQIYNLRLKGDIWDFTVFPDSITYVGHLDVMQDYFSFGLLAFQGDTFVEMVNRSSQAMEFLEDDFSDLVMTHKIVYGGPGEDDFFNLIQQF